MSTVLCIGNIILTVTAVGQWFPNGYMPDGGGIIPQKWGLLLGLHIIALGMTGFFIDPRISSQNGPYLIFSVFACITVSIAGY